MDKEQVDRIANAIEEIGYGGRDSTPGGALEAISLALGGQWRGEKDPTAPVGVALSEGLSEIASAIEKGLGEIARAIEAKKD